MRFTHSLIFVRFIPCFAVGANGIPAAPTAAPHFISSSQTIRAEVGETVRLPCDVQSLGKRIAIY